MPSLPASLISLGRTLEAVKEIIRREGRYDVDEDIDSFANGFMLRRDGVEIGWAGSWYLLWEAEGAPLVLMVKPDAPWADGFTAKFGRRTYPEIGEDYRIDWLFTPLPEGEAEVVAGFILAAAKYLAGG
ncbi:MAG: hypothetical protein C4524_12385 [Candidatus Zixiibacteriota bacterium]|nr:MAG: hypothetical protein C4524_12385 [candidate division Zixibacteria bacterium]